MEQCKLGSLFSLLEGRFDNFLNSPDVCLMWGGQLLLQELNSHPLKQWNSLLSESSMIWRRLSKKNDPLKNQIHKETDRQADRSSIHSTPAIWKSPPGLAAPYAWIRGSLFWRSQTGQGWVQWCCWKILGICNVNKNKITGAKVSGWESTESRRQITVSLTGLGGKALPVCRSVFCHSIASY